MPTSDDKHIFTPYENTFLHSLSQAKRSVLLVTPFIKIGVVKKILCVLPQSNSLQLTLLTRFTNQVFQQKSSDLAVFHLLHQYANQFHQTKCFALNRLHAKVYIIDEDEMYITSSNLSHTGLNVNLEIAARNSNAPEIRYVSQYFDSFMSPETEITPEHVLAKERLLAGSRITVATVTQPQESFDQTEFVNEYFASPSEELTPLSEILEEPLDLLESVESATRLNEINAVLRTLHSEEYSTVGEYKLQSIRRPVLAEGDALNLEMQSKANADVQAVDDYLRHFMPFIGDAGSLSVEQVRAVFTENSWRQHYDRQNMKSSEENDYFSSIGAATHAAILALLVTQGQIFAMKPSKRFSTLVGYVIHNFDYDSSLADAGLHFLLHYSELRKDQARTLFERLLGFIARRSGFSKALAFYLRFLDRSADFIYDSYEDHDYKTLLQEFSQKTYHQVPGYELVEEKGPDHKKTFISCVKIRQHSAQGCGESKKESEKDAALHLLRSVGYVALKQDASEAILRLRKYTIPDERLEVLRGLRIVKDFAIENLRLIDVALTHRSFVLHNRYSRPYDTLAFIGAYIEQYCRFLSLYNKLEGAPTKEALADFRKLLNHSKWYGDEKYSSLGITMAIRSVEQKLSAHMERDIVQSLMAVIYLEKGMDRAYEFCEWLWEDFLHHTDSHVEDAVVALQRIVQAAHKSDAKIEYTVVRKQAMPENCTEFTVKCTVVGITSEEGKGYSVKEARKAAAAKVIVQLN